MSDSASLPDNLPVKLFTEVELDFLMSQREFSEAKSHFESSSGTFVLIELGERLLKPEGRLSAELEVLHQKSEATVQMLQRSSMEIRDVVDRTRKVIGDTQRLLKLK